MENNNEYYIVTPKPANQIDFVKLSPTAQAPVRGSEQAAGWDLYADISGDYISLYPGEVRKISTGIAIALPKGTFGAVFARSGLATKKGLAPANKVGVIDSDYRGPVIVAIRNESSDVQTIEHGERIAQLVVIPYLPVTFNEVDSIGTTARGENGFGSTGNK
jgi:dUTP pyrophosphatase